jgi:hypothetical protein
MRKRSLAFILPAVCLLLVACNSEQPKNAQSEAAPAKPKQAEPEFESGRAAFQRMYVSARTWAPDAQLVRLESMPVKEDPKDGRAGVWKALFVSASKGNTRNYQWTGVGPESQRGVEPGTPDIYSPGNASTRPFDLSFLKVDSTKAFEVADKKGGAALLKKDPNQPIKYMLFYEAARNRLLWRVLYGNSLNDAKLKVLIYASSGEFFRVEKD